MAGESGRRRKNKQLKSAADSGRRKRPQNLPVSVQEKESL